MPRVVAPDHRRRKARGPAVLNVPVTTPTVSGPWLVWVPFALTIALYLLSFLPRV
jgi:hypothetical protein